MSAPRILIAESDPSQRQIIDLLLSVDAFELHFVTSGREALEHLRDQTPDLALLAMDLPDVGGEEVCRKVRAVTRLKEMPVVLLAPEDLEIRTTYGGARLAGANLVLQRPLGDKNVRERLLHLLEHRAPAATGAEQSGAVQPGAVPGGTDPDRPPADGEALVRLAELRQENRRLRAQLATLQDENAALRSRLAAAGPGQDGPSAPPAPANGAAGEAPEADNRGAAAPLDLSAAALNPAGASPVAARPTVGGGATESPPAGSDGSDSERVAILERQLREAEQKLAELRRRYQALADVVGPGQRGTKRRGSFWRRD